MVIERVTLVDGPQPFDVDRPMHNEPVHRPFEDIGEQERQRHGEPFKPGHIVDVLDVNIKRRRADGVDDQDMHVAVIPTDDPRAIFLTESLLSFANHAALL